MLYTTLKWLHVLSAVVFLGTGLGSAWYKFRADRSGNVAVIAWSQRQIVLADWIFTVPAGVLLPVTGFAMVATGPWTLEALWVRLGIGLYAVAGLTWLPAAALQLRMRDMADEALENGTELPEAFHRDRRIWTALGAPSFLAAIVTVWLMTSKYMG